MGKLAKITNLCDICAGSYFVITEEDAAILRENNYIVGDYERLTNSRVFYQDGYFVHDILGEQVREDEISRLLGKEVKKIK